MASGGAKTDRKLALEIRTKSVEQTLVPLVTQVCLYWMFSNVDDLFRSTCRLIKILAPFWRLLCGRSPAETRLSVSRSNVLLIVWTVLTNSADVYAKVFDTVIVRFSLNLCILLDMQYAPKIIAHDCMNNRQKAKCRAHSLSRTQSHS